MISFSPLLLLTSVRTGAVGQLKLSICPASSFDVSVASPMVPLWSLFPFPFRLHHRSVLASLIPAHPRRSKWPRLNGPIGLCLSLAILVFWPGKACPVGLWNQAAQANPDTRFSSFPALACKFSPWLTESRNKKKTTTWRTKQPQRRLNDLHASCRIQAILAGLCLSSLLGSSLFLGTSVKIIHHPSRCLSPFFSTP